MAATEARRGEVWLVAFGAARAGELGKHRPAVVMTADALLETADDLVCVVGVSSSRAASALRPKLGPESGVDRDSVVVCRAVRGVAPSRLISHLGVVPEATMTEIDNAIRFVLDLDAP